MEPDSRQWRPVTGQGATGTKWSIRSSSWTWRTSLLWGWWSTGTGCPEGWWILLLWRYSKPAWTRSCAACSTWACFDRGLDQMIPRGPLQPLPFCDSLIIPSLFPPSCECFYYTASRVFYSGMLCLPSLTVVMCYLGIWIQLIFRKIFITVTNLDQFGKNLKKKKSM